MTREDDYRKLLSEASSEGPLVVGEEQALDVGRVVMEDVVKSLAEQKRGVRDLASAQRILKLLRRAAPPLCPSLTKLLSSLLSTSLKAEVQIAPIGALIDRGTKTVVCALAKDPLLKRVRSMERRRVSSAAATRRCSKCRARVLVSAEGLRLSEAGAVLVCIDCALKGER